MVLSLSKGAILAPFYAVQFPDTPQADDVLRCHLPALHLGEQVCAAGDDHRVRAVFSQQPARLVEAGWVVIGELWKS